MFLVLVLVLLGAAPACGQSPELAFVQPEKLTVSFTDGESDEVTVWLKNASGSTVAPSFAAALEDSEGAAAEAKVEAVDADGKETQPSQLQAGEVGRYRLRFLEASESSGRLLATAAGVTAASLPLSLGPESASNRGVDEALAIPFGVALLLLVPAWIFGRGKAKLTGKLGGVTELDFSKSFASTLTAVGALLGTIIGTTGVLPEETVHLSRAAFTGLNLTFGIAIVIAAAITSSAQSVEPILNKDGKKEWKVESYVLLFLVGAVITLWAVFGELWTIWLLIEELGGGKGFTSLGVTLLQILLLVAAAAMIPYTYVKVKIAVQTPEPPAPTPTPPLNAGAQAVGPPGAAGEAAPRPITLL